MRKLLLALVVAAAACGGPPTCPLSPPANGASCGDRGLACESGGDAHRRCSTFYTCEDALDPNNPTHTSWTVTPPDATCTAANAAECPATYNSAPVAKACPSDGIVCDYAEGRCDCVPCNPTGIQWRCRRWGEDVGSRCPADRPLLGARCDVDGAVCRYDDACRVTFGPDLVCFNGLWTPRLGARRTCGAPVCGLVD